MGNRKRKEGVSGRGKECIGRHKEKKRRKKSTTHQLHFVVRVAVLGFLSPVN